MTKLAAHTYTCILQLLEVYPNPPSTICGNHGLSKWPGDSGLRLNSSICVILCNKASILEPHALVITPSLGLEMPASIPNLALPPPLSPLRMASITTIPPPSPLRLASIPNLALLPSPNPILTGAPSCCCYIRQWHNVSGHNVSDILSS